VTNGKTPQPIWPVEEQIENRNRGEGKTAQKVLKCHHPMGWVQGGGVVSVHGSSPVYDRGGAENERTGSKNMGKKRYLKSAPTRPKYCTGGGEPLKRDLKGRGRRVKEKKSTKRREEGDDGRPEG